MTTHKVSFYPILPSLGGNAAQAGPEQQPRIESSTCTEAESFVLQVLDDSMQPEFRKSCIIVIDPTGVARSGSYVLARSIAEPDQGLGETDGYVFRQLLQGADGGWLLVPLNPAFSTEQTHADLSRIVGVIVQRAGVRRRDHKHYD